MEMYADDDDYGMYNAEGRNPREKKDRASREREAMDLPDYQREIPKRRNPRGKKDSAPRREAIPVYQRENYIQARTISVDALSRKIVCLYNLRGRCAYGKNCDAVHCELPYQWLYKQRYDDDWTFVDETQNVEMEEAFCNVTQEKCSLDLQDTHLEVDFNDMTAMDKDNQTTDTDNEYDVHRLSTHSSATTQQPLATDWVWFWETPENHWIKYGDIYNTGYHDYSADIKSPQIERAYLANPFGSVKFKTQAYSYVLDYRKMVQQNTRVDLLTKRAVRRRPKYISRAEVAQQQKFVSIRQARAVLRSAGTEVPACIPAHWDFDKQEHLLDHYKCPQLSSKSLEYKKIAAEFTGSLGKSVSVTSINRIQNGVLYDNYANKMTRMSHNRRMPPEERQLFHGTKKEFVEAICRQGCDFRLCGKSHGTRYGQGSYFAQESSKADEYTTRKDSHMFMVRVIVGEYVNGNPDHRRPPPKDPHDPLSELYDSCVDDISSPKLFVVFDNGQVLPEYLIRYKREMDVRRVQEIRRVQEEQF